MELLETLLASNIPTLVSIRLTSLTRASENTFFMYKLFKTVEEWCNRWNCKQWIT